MKLLESVFRLALNSGKALLHSHGRVSWRRLAVLCVATGLLLDGRVSEQTWLLVAGLYIGGEAAQSLTAIATRKADG